MTNINKLARETYDIHFYPQTTTVNWSLLVVIMNRADLTEPANSDKYERLKRHVLGYARQRQADYLTHLRQVADQVYQDHFNGATVVSWRLFRNRARSWLYREPTPQDAVYLKKYLTDTLKIQLTE